MALDVGSTLAPDATGPVNGWWKDFLEVIPRGYQDLIVAEEHATRMVHFHPTFMPGLLQTRRYATAVTPATTLKNMTATDAAVLAQVRMLRQLSAFDVARHKQFVFLMDEACLYRPVGPLETMREQLEHLLDMASRPNVTVVVLPFRAPPHPGLLGPFMILQNAEDLDDVLCFEWQLGNSLERDPDLLRRYGDLAERLARSDPDGRAARHLITSALDRLAGGR